MSTLPRHISLHVTLAQDGRGLEGAPNLRRLLSVADRLPPAGQDPITSLCALFDSALATDPPVAAIESIGAGHDSSKHDTAGRHWLRADPVHLRPQRDDLVCWPVDDLDARDSAALLDTLNGFLAQDAMALMPLDAHRWLLAIPSRTDLHATPLSRVAGLPVGPHLPTGSDATHWLTRLTELQMLLHDHPVNADRESAGKVPVGSLWLWGGGAPPAIGTRRFDLVYARDQLARGLAHCAGSTPRDIPEAITELEPATSVLLALPVQHDPAQLDAVWFSALRSALATGQIEDIDIVLCRDQVQHFRIRRRHLWRFWRRAFPL